MMAAAGLTVAVVTWRIMLIELLIHWNGNERGTKLNLDKPVAELLVERGAAIEVRVDPKMEQRVQPSEVKKK